MAVHCGFLGPADTGPHDLARGELARLRSAAQGRGALHGLWILASFVLLFAATAEWYFWQEFASRFNFIAVDYLVYTREVIANIRESYPAAGLLVGMLGVATLAWLPLRGVLNRSFCAPSRLRERFFTTLVLVAIPALSLIHI